MELSETIKERIEGWQKRALTVGVIAAAVSVAGAFLSPAQFFQSYLVGYLFWIGIAAGSIVILSLHHLVAGGWGFTIQRILESSARTIPLMALLFIPVVLGMKDLFIWARPEVVADDLILQHKAPYLNQTFFVVRALFFFLVWSVLYFFLTKWSADQDKNGDAALSRKLQRFGGPGILLFMITMTFATIDWSMSLDPHWFSTIFGLMFIIGQGLLTLAFATIVVSGLTDDDNLAAFVKKKHFHDLGNLLLAFVSLWAYMSVSQFLIIWSGNLPEEIPWYLHRSHGGWDWLVLFVVIFHFAVPFALLLLRRNKRRANILVKIAFGIALMRLVDLFWVIAPNFHPHGISVHWLDLVAPAGIGGIWLAFFFYNLKGRALLPINDPRLSEAAAHE